MPFAKDHQMIGTLPYPDDWGVLALLVKVFQLMEVIFIGEGGSAHDSHAGPNRCKNEPQHLRRGGDGLAIGPTLFHSGYRARKWNFAHDIKDDVILGRFFCKILFGVVDHATRAEFPNRRHVRCAAHGGNFGAQGCGNLQDRGGRRHPADSLLCGEASVRAA